MTPKEQEAHDKDPTRAQPYEYEKRIVRTAFRARDYNNITVCSIELDNGYRIAAEANGIGDIAQTDAYLKARHTLQMLFDFLKCEHNMRLASLAREAGMAATFGRTGGE